MTGSRRPSKAISELFTPMQEARVAGTSYPTIKQWIYNRKIHPTKTARGHYRIAAVKSSVSLVKVVPGKNGRSPSTVRGLAFPDVRRFLPLFLAEN